MPLNYEDHFCDWLFAQGVDPFEICQLAFIELPETEAFDVAAYDAALLKEMGIAA